MATPLTPAEALRALLPAISAEQSARLTFGAASEPHLESVSDLAAARLRAEDALRWADSQAEAATRKLRRLSA